MIKLTQLLDDYDLPELADRIDREILTKQCSYCHAIHENGKWRPYHENMNERNVSHGTCPKCEHILKNELNEMMKTAMRPFSPKDIKDPEAHEQLKSLVDDIPPVKHIGRSDKGHPILTIPQYLMPFGPTGGLVKGTVGDHDSKWPFFEPILKSLGMENQPTVFISEGKRSPWNVRHELHHIDEFDLPQKERPNVDVESKDRRKEIILKQIRYLLDPREMYANVGVVLEFVANKGKIPPAKFMPNDPDRSEAWIRRYTNVPKAIVRSVLDALENDDAKKILPNKVKIREIADLAQEDFIKAALREEPWIKKHLRMPENHRTAMRPFDENIDVADAEKWQNFKRNFPEGHRPILERGRTEKGAVEYRVSPEAMNSLTSPNELPAWGEYFTPDSPYKQKLEEWGLPSGEDVILRQNDDFNVREHERTHEKQTKNPKASLSWTPYRGEFNDNEIMEYKTRPHEAHAALMSALNWRVINGGKRQMPGTNPHDVFETMTSEFVNEIPKESLVKIQRSPHLQWRYAKALVAYFLQKEYEVAWKEDSAQFDHPETVLLSPEEYEYLLKKFVQNDGVKQPPGFTFSISTHDADQI